MTLSAFRQKSRRSPSHNLNKKEARKKNSLCLKTFYFFSLLNSCRLGFFFLSGGGKDTTQTRTSRQKCDFFFLFWVRVGVKGVGGWTLRARFGLKTRGEGGWCGGFRSQPKCLLQEVVCRRGGIPAPLKSGRRYLVTPVGLPWLPSTHIPQPSFTPVHTAISQSLRYRQNKYTHTVAHINTGTNKPTRSPAKW